MASDNNEALIKKLKKERAVNSLGVDDALQTKVIDAYKENGPVKDLEKQVIIEVFAEKFKLETMQDTLDLDRLLKKVYAYRQHPLAGFRNLISVYSTSSFAVLTIIWAALVIMIFAVSFKFKKFLAWTGGGLAAAGSVTAILGIIRLFLPFIQSLPAKATMSMESGSSSLPGDLAATVLEYFLDSYFKTLLLLGIAVAVLVVGGHYLARYYKLRQKKDSSEISYPEETAKIDQTVARNKGLRRGLTAFGRVPAVLILPLAIWQAALWGIGNVKSEVEGLRAALDSNPMKAEGFNIFETLSEETRLEGSEKK